mmetsp:Transcript_86550/g.279373  ORF Transcript_86550/g.279373 Transcript_86550/m.279373 type:complete len:311 (+) Transcript_86550:4096-5028(+)
MHLDAALAPRLTAHASLAAQAPGAPGRHLAIHDVQRDLLNFARTSLFDVRLACFSSTCGWLEHLALPELLLSLPTDAPLRPVTQLAILRPFRASAIPSVARSCLLQRARLFMETAKFATMLCLSPDAAHTHVLTTAARSAAATPRHPQAEFAIHNVFRAHTTRLCESERTVASPATIGRGRCDDARLLRLQGLRVAFRPLRPRGELAILHFAHHLQRIAIHGLGGIADAWGAPASVGSEIPPSGAQAGDAVVAPLPPTQPLASHRRTTIILHYTFGVVRASAGLYVFTSAKTVLHASVHTLAICVAHHHP